MVAALGGCAAHTIGTYSGQPRAEQIEALDTGAAALADLAVKRQRKRAQNEKREQDEQDHHPKKASKPGKLV